MAKQKAGAKKLRRSNADKAYYARYAAAYPSKLIRRKGWRQKRIEAAKLHPEIGSPSQLRTRGIKRRICEPCVSEIAGLKRSEG